MLRSGVRRQRWVGWAACQRARVKVLVVEVSNGAPLVSHLRSLLLKPCRPLVSPRNSLYVVLLGDGHERPA